MQVRHHRQATVGGDDVLAWETKRLKFFVYNREPRNLTQWTLVYKMSKYHNIPGIGFSLIASEKHKIWKKIQVAIIAQQEIFQYQLFFMFRHVLPLLTISDKVLLSNANP